VIDLLFLVEAHNSTSTTIATIGLRTLDSIKVFEGNPNHPTPLVQIALLDFEGRIVDELCHMTIYTDIHRVVLLTTIPGSAVAYELEGDTHIAYVFKLLVRGDRKSFHATPVVVLSVGSEHNCGYLILISAIPAWKSSTTTSISPCGISTTTE
jgi:hypothetical protein